MPRGKDDHTIFDTLFIERWGQSLFPFNLGELWECFDLWTI